MELTGVGRCSRSERASSGSQNLLFCQVTLLWGYEIWSSEQTLDCLLSTFFSWRNLHDLLTATTSKDKQHSILMISQIITTSGKHHRAIFAHLRTTKKKLLKRVFHVSPTSAHCPKKPRRLVFLLPWLWKWLISFLNYVKKQPGELLRLRGWAT